MKTIGSATVTAAAAATGIGLLLIGTGVAIGARFWPRVALVEQRVVAPLRSPTVRLAPTEALPDLVEATCPALVSISLTPLGGSPDKRNDPGQPALTGIVVSQDGFIATSGAALTGRDTVLVQLSDGRRLSGAVKARDPTSGIAIIKVDGTSFATMEFADSDLPRIGTWGFSLSSRGASGCAVETGLISRDTVSDGPSLRLSLVAGPPGVAQVEGAPFIGADGRVLGMAETSKEVSGDESTALIPGSVAAPIISAMMRDETAPAAPRGVVAGGLAPVVAKLVSASGEAGAVITIVKPGSQAQQAGLRAGDVVLSVGGTPISSAAELGRALDSATGSVDVQIARRGATRSLIVEP